MYQRVFIHPLLRGPLALGALAALVPALLNLGGCGTRPDTDESTDPLARAAQALSAPVCVTLQRGVFGTVEDAQIASTPPTSNYGAKSAANVNGGATTRQLLLRFDLSAIPPNATVTSAKLTLTAYQATFGAGATLRAHRILAPWTESAVTWSLFNASFSATVEASALSQKSSATPIAFTDLTALAQTWVSASSANQGLLLEQPETTTTGIGTSEAAIVSSRPRLDVCYQPLICPPGFADCNNSGLDGCETNLALPEHCGACGNACSFANAAAACSSGACALGACVVGFVDCDGNAQSGCETQATSCSSAALDTGKSATAMVSAGAVSKSSKYTMVHTLGQSTQNQDRTTSPTYRMQGGINGSNGSVQ